MKKANLLTIFFLVIAFSSCENDKDENNQNQDIVDNDSIPGASTIMAWQEEIVAADNEFSIDLFQTIADAEEPDSNIFVSPTSVALALGMTYNGAANETKTAMEEALKKQGMTTQQINYGYQSLTDALVNADPEVLLKIANAIYSREGFTLEQKFVDDNKFYFDADVRNLDFGNPSAVDTVNQWCADHTNNKIEKIVDVLSADVVMVLLNAIYFKGTWQKEFADSLTMDRNFYPEDGSTIQVPTMKSEDTLQYFENDLLQAVELPYGDGKYSMVILLPANDKKVDDIVTALSVDNWDTWTGSMSEKEVDLYLSKFKFKYKIALNQVLSDMGMGIAFNPGGADFSGINKDMGTSLYISKVLHKSFVEVNEEGTEAAAVTAVIIDNTSINDSKKYVNVDRPFLFIIKEKTTNSIVFIGKVMKPVIEK